MDKLVNRKLDLIMEKLGIDTKEFKPAPPPAPVARTAAEQQAIDNAPKPTSAVGPRGPRVTPLNAPSVASSTPPVAVPPDAVGDVTVETVETVSAPQVPRRR